MDDPAFPAQGLPQSEKFVLNLLLKIGSAFRSDSSIANSFQQSARTILSVVDTQDVGVLSQSYSIPRLQGIEESSRHWSVLMVLDHLTNVNLAIVDTVRALRSGNQPFATIKIADYKPNPDADVETIARFRETSNRYLSFAKSHRPLRTHLTARHPWFGELDGHQWHALAAAHQKIHLRQIYKILAMIGVA